MRRLRSERPPRTPEQEARRAFLLAPIQIRIVPRHTWAGVLIDREAGSESGRKASYSQDESYIRYGRGDEEID